MGGVGSAGGAGACVRWVCSGWLTELPAEGVDGGGILAVVRVWDGDGGVNGLGGGYMWV